MTTVIYVAGYGRSGSTLLDLLLGAHPAVRSLGEAGMVLEQLSDPDATCSCGAKIAECGTWGPVLQQIRDRFDMEQVRRGAVSEEHWLACFRWFHRRDATVYSECQEHLLRILRERSGISCFVDSSKTAYRFAWRPRALARCRDLDVRILHLLRHPAAVLASSLKGRNSRLAAGRQDSRAFEVPVTLIGWNLSNLFAAFNGRLLGKSRCLRVEFDELLDSPDVQFARIGAFLGLDLSVVAALVRERQIIPEGHLIAANRMARGGEVRVSIATGGRRPAARFLQRLAIQLFGSPLYLLLKPPKSDSASASAAGSQS